MTDEEDFRVWGVAYLTSFELLDNTVDTLGFQERLNGLRGVRVRGVAVAQFVDGKCRIVPLGGVLDPRVGIAVEASVVETSA